MAWSLRAPVRGASVPGVVVVILGMLALSACRVDRVPFNRLEEGRKFLDAGRPAQAARYFVESLEREEATRSVAQALVLVAYHLALEEREAIESERAKYAQLRTDALRAVRSDPSALDVLAGTLGRHNEAAYAAAQLLVEIGEDAAGVVVRAYETRAMDRPRLLDVLTRMGPDAAPAMQRAIEEHDLVAAERVALVRLLGPVGTQDAHGCLLALRDGDYAPGVRAEAAAALYRAGKDDEREYLVGALDSAFVLERTAAAYAMSHGTPPDAAVLISHIADPSRDVRRYIAEALGGTNGDPEAIGALVRTVREDEQDTVAEAAIKALRRHGPAVIDPVLDAVDSEPEWTRRQRLITVLTHEDVRAGFSQDQEFRLYERYQAPGEHPEVQWIIGRVLKDLEAS